MEPSEENVKDDAEEFERERNIIDSSDDSRGRC